MSVTGPANEISQSRLNRRYGEPAAALHEHNAQSLELLPNEDLLPVALELGLITEASEFDRAAVIAELAAKGIVAV